MIAAALHKQLKHYNFTVLCCPIIEYSTVTLQLSGRFLLCWKRA